MFHCPIRCVFHSGHRHVAAVAMREAVQPQSRRRPTRVFRRLENVRRRRGDLNDLYLDWIGHSPCNDGYVFAMLNVRLQNRADCATMVTYWGAACIGGFEFLPLLHLHIIFVCKFYNHQKTILHHATI